MHYELWHTPTTNFMESFDSLDEAASAIDEAVRRDGPTILADTHLVSIDDAGAEHVVAEGEAIIVVVKRALADEHRHRGDALRKVG